MLNITEELKNQLEQNIIVHQNMMNMSKDIIDIIKDTQKKLKKGGKLFNN